MFQELAECPDSFVWVKRTARVRIVFPGRFRRHADLSGPNRFLISVPHIVENLAVDEVVENDVTIGSPATAEFSFAGGDDFFL
jgi:hypothetical protein